MAKRIELTGRVFGRLTVIEPAFKRKVQWHWRCLCRCGNSVTVAGHHLREHTTRSCGCLRDEIAAELARAQGRKNATHGMTGTRTYVSWKRMKERCYRKQAVNYPRYGGRGIRVCKRWYHSFSAFLQDMGERPPGMTLDRIDSNGHYTPSNCKWSTTMEQHENRTMS